MPCDFFQHRTSIGAYEATVSKRFKGLICKGKSKAPSNQSVLPPEVILFWSNLCNSLWIYFQININKAPITICNLPKYKSIKLIICVLVPLIATFSSPSDTCTPLGINKSWITSRTLGTNLGGWPKNTGQLNFWRCALVWGSSTTLLTLFPINNLN